MNELSDQIIDRRNLRKKVTFWRILTFLMICVAIIAATGFGAIRKSLDKGDHIARIPITGVIVTDQKILDMIKKIKDDDSVKGVILNINSPGGTTSGSEDLFLALKELGEKKPMVSFINGIGASGSYIAAMSSDYIIARETSIVGSIGVIMQYPNVYKFLNTIGVEFESIKSSPLKAEPSGTAPTPPEARQAMQNMISDSYDWFKNLVSQRRGLKGKALEVVSDGRVFSGKKSLELKLINALGSEKDAVSWLETEKKVTKGLTIKEWKPEKDTPKLSILGLTASGLQLLGFDSLSQSLKTADTTKDISQLDGVLAIWNPSLK